MFTLSVVTYDGARRSTTAGAANNRPSAAARSLKYWGSFGGSELSETRDPRSDNRANATVLLNFPIFHLHAKARTGTASPAGLVVTSRCQPIVGPS